MQGGPITVTGLAYRKLRNSAIQPIKLTNPPLRPLVSILKRESRIKISNYDISLVFRRTV